MPPPKGGKNGVEEAKEEAGRRRGGEGEEADGRYGITKFKIKWIRGI